MSFGPGDMGSAQYWHRQSFPLKVTLSPAGNGRLSDMKSKKQHGVVARGECYSLLVMVCRTEDGRALWWRCVSTLSAWVGHSVRQRTETTHGMLLHAVNWNSHQSQFSSSQQISLRIMGVVTGYSLNVIGHPAWPHPPQLPISLYCA